MRIAFDIGGVISKYPEVCRGLIHALAADVPRHEVFVVTDMHDRTALLETLRRNAICPPVLEVNVLVADYERHGEGCKAVILRDRGIDLLVDDHGGYLAWPWPGPAPMRLLVQPDQRRPYHSHTWRTTDVEGRFGRRAYFDA
jgi:hypothetical protein